MARILCEIPTYNRVRTLGRCLAALGGQTFQDWDLLIVNDSPSLKLDSDPVTAEWLKRHRKTREVWLEDGLGIGQVYAHNLALWERPWRSYEYILRLDDDVLLNAWAIQNMVHALDRFPMLAGVSGLWFEHEENKEWWSDRDVPTREEWLSPELDGRMAGGVVSNWHQRIYHDFRPKSNGDPLTPMPVEHLYGSMMYRSEFMREAGGWPEIFSHNVHHGEETDGTYRLFLRGYNLDVLPIVTGQHLRDMGGIRSAGVGTENERRAMDDPIRNARLQDMPGSYEGKITVGIWAQHAVFTGGGVRFFFELLAALEKSPYLDVYTVGDHMTPKEVKSLFGLDLGDTREAPDKLDVLIQVGDDMDWFGVMQDRGMVIPEATNKLLFVFYPFGDRAPRPDEFCQAITLSNFVVERIKKRWKVAAQRIYPLVRPAKRLKKRNWMLIAGRIDQWKGTQWLMERFLEWDLPDWELHIIGATQGSLQEDYIVQVREFANLHDNIFVHYDIDLKEMQKFYGRSRILLAAKGMLAEDHLREAEHFGMVVVEAISAWCVPLVYDLGGHQETVPSGWRWKTAEELRKLVFDLVETNTLVMPDIKEFLDQDLFYEQWERLVLQANAGVLQLESITTRIEVLDKPVLAVISDTPPRRRYTGFGVVTGEIVPSFVKAGFEVYYYAILDDIPAKEGEFDFNFWPMQTNDPQGEKGLVRFLNEVKPDAIWSLYDPGNLYKYLIFRELGIQARKADGSTYPMVVYFPVEGKPCPEVTGYMVEHVQRSGGKAITYCKAGAKAIKDQFGFDVDWAWHGLDHADFRPYSEEDRQMLKHLVGLEGKFITGSFGINKRVKQYDLLVHAAKVLKDWGKDEDILFYLHTEPEEPILQGYPLKHMVNYYGVKDMFLWKPDTYRQRGGKYKGADYEIDTLEMARRLTKPVNPKERGYLFGGFDIISRYNILDLYVDCSSVEGWNLPLGEAMACGIPCVSVHDNLARSEIYGGAAQMLMPSMFSTWHNGVQLEIVDPESIAKQILEIKDDPNAARFLTDAGLERVQQYKWADCRQVMVNAVKEVLRIA